MKVLQLHLQAFGPFTDLTLDFAEENLGLHVVYGPNEAGKSTALRAIHAALFGIPHHTSDNFIHDHKQLRVGATLQNCSGQRISFLRRKGRKDTLLNTDPQLGPHPDSALLPFLGSVDADTYARVFGIGHRELRRGGEEMHKLQGLCGESLFAAGLGSRVGGGAGLADILKQLDEQAADIYSSKKRSCSIKRAKTEYEAATKERRAAEFSSSQWQQLQDCLQMARNGLDAVRHDLLELRTESSRLGRLRDALKPLAEREQMRDELAARTDVMVLPESYSADERVKCQTALDESQRQIATLAAELHGEAGLQAQLAAIHVAEELLASEQIVAALQQRLGAHLKAAHDRMTRLNPRRSETLARIAELRRNLGLAADTNVEPLRLSADRRVAIQNLASQERSLRTAPQELAAKREQLQQSLQTTLRELESLGDPRDVSELRRAIDQTRAGGDLEQQLATHRHALAQSQQKADGQLAALSLWSGSLADLVRLPLPLRETVDHFEAQFAENSEQQRVRADRCGELSVELARLQEQLAALEKTQHVPTEAELTDLRQRRDDGWKLVRRVWQQGLPENSTEVTLFAGGNSLADTFQRCVAEADRMADRLRREAERVTTKVTLCERRTRLEQQLTAEQQQLAQCRQLQAQLQASWKAHWLKLRIQPLTPREMRGWLQQHAQLMALATDVDRYRTQLQQTSQRHAECHRRLTALLTELSVQLPDSPTLAELLQLAVALVDNESDIHNRRAELTRDASRIGDELQAVQAQQARADQALVRWQTAWREAMTQIGCEEQAAAEQANERMSRLGELFAQIDNLDKIDGRIRDIDDDAAEFEQHVRVLVSRLAPDLQPLPAEQAAAELQTRWTKARTDQIRRDELAARAELRQTELEDLQRREQQLIAQLNQLCRIAGVDDANLLAEVERDSREVTQRRTRLQQLEDQLWDLCGGTTIEQLAADAQGRSLDELTAQLAELHQQIEGLERAREEHAARVRELENACKAADGNPLAAEADERALGILARMHSEAERFLQLRLAATLLRQQIEQFRAENQDPLLCRASSLFARLTCHEFDGLRTDYADGDQPVIFGLRGNGQRVPVDGMSDGTCDQLYLALRLAYLESRLIQQEPLPLVVDDVLLNFDNDRARATLEVLAEFATQTQVIFFTHHRHLVEIAEASVPDQLSVHELDGRASDLPPQPVAVSGTARRPR